MSTPQPTAQTITQTNQLPQHILDASKANIASANQIADTPWSGYSGARLAGWTPMMDQAAGATSDMAFGYQPQQQQAYDALSGAGAVQGEIAGQRGPGNVEAFMNPNMQAIIDAINRNGAMQRVGIDRQATARGAYGSDAHGVVEGMQREGETRQIGELAAGVYDRALGASLARDQLALGGAAGLAQTGAGMSSLAQAGQNMGYRDINALLGIGGMQRQDAQSLINSAISDFYEQRDWPVRGLNLKTAALAATPYEQTRTTTQPYYGASTGATAVGGAVAGGGLGYQVGGPWGAAAGAGLGALAGLF